MAAASINGVAVASIASLNGVAIGSIANFNGITLGSPPAESDVLVADAGTGAANGTYTYTGTWNGSPYYNLSGTNAEVSAVSFDGGTWAIYGSGGEHYYLQDDPDASYPWIGTSWSRDVGDAPVPTVTEV